MVVDAGERGIARAGGRSDALCDVHANHRRTCTRDAGHRVARTRATPARRPECGPRHRGMRGTGGRMLRACVRAPGLAGVSNPRHRTAPGDRTAHLVHLDSGGPLHDQATSLPPPTLPSGQRRRMPHPLDK